MTPAETQELHDLAAQLTDAGIDGPFAYVELNRWPTLSPEQRVEARRIASMMFAWRRETVAVPVLASGPVVLDLSGA